MILVLYIEDIIAENNRKFIDASNKQLVLTENCLLVGLKKLIMIKQHERC